MASSHRAQGAVARTSGGGDVRAGRVRTADMLVPHLKPTDMQAFIQKYEKCLRSTPNGGPVPIGILVTIDKKPIQYVIDDSSLRHTVADTHPPALVCEPDLPPLQRTTVR